MKKQFLIAIVFAAITQTLLAQQLHVNGIMHINDNTVVHATTGLDATATPANLTADGHLIISSTVTGEDQITLGLTAHLDLRTTAEYEFSNNAEFAALSLSGGAKATVAPGKHILLSGDLTNSSSEGLILEAVATGYAQLKFDGTYSGSGEVTMQQYISGVGWHNVATPFTGAKAGVFGEVGTDRHANAQNLFGWDARSAYTWVNVANNNANLTDGAGYFGYYGTTPNGFEAGIEIGAGPWTIEMAGEPITSVTPPMDNNILVVGTTWEGFRDSTQTNGWNLIANPFTATLDFAALTKNNVNNSFYIWNPTENNGDGFYSYYSPSGTPTPNTGQGLGSSLGQYIAPLQSIWVQANASSPSLPMTMATHATVAQSPVYLRPSFDRLVLRVEAENDTAIADQTVVAMIEGTTDGFDGEWDAHKFMNVGQTPNIYSTYGLQVIANNAINYGPGHSDKKTVPIAFKSSHQGTSYTIIYDDQYMLNTYAVYLEDKLAKTFTDLNAQDYTFINDTSMTDRFVLHFRVGVLSIDAPELLNSNSGLHAWVFGGQAHLNSRINGNVALSLYDLTGKQLQSGQMSVRIGQRYEWPLRQDLAAGVYLLRIQTTQGTETIKFTR